MYMINCLFEILWIKFLGLLFGKGWFDDMWMVCEGCCDGGKGLLGCLDER